MTSFENGYALVVGVANYAHVRKLPSSVLEDANSISRLLQDKDFCGYPTQQVKLLTDAEATAVSIKSGLKWLAERVGEEDTAVIYFSGHGGQIDTGPNAGDYLIPYEASVANLATTAIADTDLIAMLNKIKAGRLLVLFDCCHASGMGDVKGGDLTQQAMVKSGLDEKLYDRLGQGKGRAVIASSRSDEVSWVYPNMDNSLFTHYLLQALKGGNAQPEDGLVRLFDLFEYVSNHVTADQPKQHPILKAEIEKNFPIALHLGGKKAISTAQRPITKPGMTKQPTIENHQQITLSDTEQNILLEIFAEYERVVVKDEFSEGFGGGHVLLIRPIMADAAHLAAVVKLGPIAIIQQEWLAYKQFVAQRVPNVAQIDGDMVLSQDETWAGIRYPLAGYGRFSTASFRKFCQTATSQDIGYVLQNHLFPSIDALWQDNRVYHEQFIPGSFDPVLPVNFFVQSTPNSFHPPTSITPQTVYQQTFQPGTSVTLSGFTVIEVDEHKLELTLNAPPNQGIVSNSCRIRVTGVYNISEYTVGDTLSTPLTGTIQSTRELFLQQTAARIFNGSINAYTPTISLPGIDNPLPNPILALASLLKQTRDVRIGSIHGDLNLENILVQYDHQSRHVHLIDFANARRDIVLHDLWRLEAGIWLYLVPGLLQGNGRFLINIPQLTRAIHTNLTGLGQPGTAPELEKPLHILTIIRQRAQLYLVQTNAWEEYYKGLIPYLLGALKFKNLDQVPTAPLPKQVAFVAAATLLQLIQEPPRIKAAPAIVQPADQPDPIAQNDPNPQNIAAKPAKPRPPRPKNLRMFLLQFLNKHLSEQDLRNLCVAMDIDYENIPGPAKIDKARELILYLQRHSRLEEIFEYGPIINEDVDWPE